MRDQRVIKGGGGEKFSYVDLIRLRRVEGLTPLLRWCIRHVSDSLLVDNKVVADGAI